MPVVINMIVKYETWTNKGSHLIGMTIKEIEDKYPGVKILHLHPPNICRDNRIGPHPDFKIIEGYYIKAEGSFENIKKLRLNM